MAMTLARRLHALELAQDGKCAACWERCIVAVSAYRDALERHGASLNAIYAYIACDEATWATISDEQQQRVAAAIPLSQAELDTANKAAERYEKMAVSCSSWLARRQGQDD